MRRIPDASAEGPHRFVQDSVQPGGAIHTDGWRGYSGLNTKGYVHEVTVVKGRKETASELPPRVHRVISLLKRWPMGTHQGAAGDKHVDYYPNEFTFRFNRRESRIRGKLFFRLARQVVAIEPSTYDMMIRQPRAQAQKAKPQAVGATRVKHIPSLNRLDPAQALPPLGVVDLMASALIGARRTCSSSYRLCRRPHPAYALP